VVEAIVVHRPSGHHCATCGADRAVQYRTVRWSRDSRQRGGLRTVGGSYVAEGSWDDVVADATDQIESGGDADTVAWAYLYRAVAHGNSGQFDDAIADTTVALELASNDPWLLADAHRNRAAAYLGLRQWEDAIADATTIELAETSGGDYNPAWAHLVRGNAYGELGRNDLAKADFNKARDLSDNPSIAQQAQELMRQFDIEG
jgi:tetratricopeptide (TPR) repeat protein